MTFIILEFAQLSSLDGKIYLNMNLNSDFIHDLRSQFTGDFVNDPASRWLYSTDASIYQIEPLGVAFPRNLDDLSIAVSQAAKYRIPIVARGAGSSLAGQAIGPALIIDCSRYLTNILDINLTRKNDQVTSGTVTAEPGIILNALNKTVAQYGLQFGPDPASAERATLGGSIANNATGAHSILYGMAADHLLATEVILSDGSIARFSEREVSSCPNHVTDVESRIYQAALKIRENYAQVIQNKWPRIWRRSSGYNLNYLVPWMPVKPIGWDASYNPKALYNGYPDGHTINLASLIAGSEGTLAIIRKATIQLVPIPKYTVLGILGFRSLSEACDAVPEILSKHHPSAVEVISSLIIRLAGSVPAYAAQLSWVKDLHQSGHEPEAILIIEFSGNDQKRIVQQAHGLRSDVYIAETPAMQKQVWAIRKVGLGILQSRPGEKKPATFIEDLVVPVENLGEFVREMDEIMIEHNTIGDFYAHASAGCLHFRPMLNIKNVEGLREMRSIAEEAVNLVLRLGGSTSGEHGDGMARSEWLEKAYGSEILTAFRLIKTAADPAGILNPGKIIDAPRMDENLRLLPSIDLAWDPMLDFFRNGGAEGAKGLLGAIDMCNGAGVCRKAESVMCPSFQVTHDEKYSTRGRANLLRALFIHSKNMRTGDGLTTRHAEQNRWEQTVWESFDLCLACKGCKSECPSGVDMAKLKYEFMNHYYARHHRRMRDYLFGYIGVVLPLGALFAPFVNVLMRWHLLRQVTDKFFGLSCKRPFPRFSYHAKVHPVSGVLEKSKNNQSDVTVLFLRDSFNHFFYPDIEASAIRLLRELKINVKIIPAIGAGRTLISKGFLQAAKNHAKRVINAIRKVDPLGEYPIIGIEPSEIFTLTDEYLDFFPGEKEIHAIAERTWMLDEFIIRLGRILPTIFTPSDVLLHGHCYQKSRAPSPDGKPIGVGATTALLNAVGYKVTTIDDGCCGMAGAFGYESEHYDTSVGVAELTLLPVIREAKKRCKNIYISTPGVSCHAQIEDGMGIAVYHPIQLVDMVFQFARE